MIDSKITNLKLRKIHLPVQKKSPLSEQELKVVNLLADGLTRKKIAKEMSLSPHTIDCYIRRIYTKLHVTRWSMLIPDEAMKWISSRLI